ncbi:MAG TPA: ATP-binding cassette domain-containing protein [Casimicrobiaceae bacterium]|jgi:putative thiamine transport system ATP-binding protein
MMAAVKGLTLHGVHISLGAHRLIPSLDFTIAPGERVTVMGPSGSGKSTLLAYIAGTLEDVFTAEGRILIDGDDVTDLVPERRRVGILFQDDLLFPHLSVGENLAFALPPALRVRDARRGAIARALAEAELPNFADRDPATLSGGQRARVALMRTLLAEPRVLLLDEPFNKLDSQLRHDFRRFVFEHASDRGLPILLVTHDAMDAEAAGGRVITVGA